MAPTSATEITPQIRSELGRLSGEFCAKLPAAAVETDQYTAQPGDRLSGLSFAVPDGTYRQIGGEWLFTVRSGKFVEAARRARAAERDDVIDI